MNESAALAHLLERGQLTRNDLRELTGLSKPTISEALRRLAGAGLASVVGHVSDAASRFLAALADRIAVGLAAVVAVLDPGLVVLAGEVGRAGGTALRDAVTAAMARTAPLGTSIAVTSIDDDAVLLGALDAGLAAVREALIGVKG